MTRAEPWTRDEAFDTFKAAAVDVLSVDTDKVVPEANFADDLDADSLDLVEFVMALEEKFDVEIPESDLEGVKTVGDAFDLVCTKINI
jgi:acyl carrier protein